MERIVPAAAFALILVDCPFETGIDNGDIGDFSGPERATIESEELGRVLRVELNQTRQIDRFLFVNEDVEEEPELRFEAEDAEWRHVEFNFLLVSAMRRVIAREHGNRSIRDAFDQGIDMLPGTK